METSLPDLPFMTYGNAEIHSFALRSSACPLVYPKTDLENIRLWSSFPNDIHQAIQSATARSRLPATPFHINCWTRRTIVANEEAIRAHAMTALHVPVEEVLEMLGVQGSFALSGPGNHAIVGDPDYSWVESHTLPHPKLVVEYKIWWVTDLVDLLAAFENGTRGDRMSQQSLEALQQVYGYMNFNNNRFGILTNWQRALFLRRPDTPDRKTIEFYLVELNRLNQPISMLKAWVGMVLLAQDDWFYASPTISSDPPDGISMTTCNTGRYHIVPVKPCLILDFRFCCFNLTSARHGKNGCTVYGRLLRPSISGHDLEVIFKVVDVFRYPDAPNWLKHEARVYGHLQELQGVVIPTLYGFYSVWGILRLLALQPVGNCIPEDEEINQALLLKMKAALQRIHNAGFVHGDIARRNFCRTAKGDIFLVDLEKSQRCVNQSELDDEMGEVDKL